MYYTSSEAAAQVRNDVFAYDCNSMILSVLSWLSCKNQTIHDSRAADIRAALYCCPCRSIQVSR